MGVRLVEKQDGEVQPHVSKIGTFGQASLQNYLRLSFHIELKHCKVIGDHRCTLSTAAILAMLAKTPELFLSPGNT